MCGSYTVCGQLQRWILFIFFLSSSKIHLFDIDVPGKIRFQESETLSPGSSLSLFDTRERQPQTLAFCLAVWMSIHWSDVFLLQRSAKWVLGSAMTWGSRSSPSSTAGRVSVWKECLDFVFLWCPRADWTALLSSGCQLLVYPGAFNMTTGPAHWELLQRGRSDWGS